MSAAVWLALMAARQPDTTWALARPTRSRTAEARSATARREVESAEIAGTAPPPTGEGGNYACTTCYTATRPTLTATPANLHYTPR